jgi:hypothetical protein
MTQLILLESGQKMFQTTFEFQTRNLGSMPKSGERHDGGSFMMKHRFQSTRFWARTARGLGNLTIPAALVAHFNFQRRQQWVSEKARCFGSSAFPFQSLFCWSCFGADGIGRLMSYHQAARREPRFPGAFFVSTKRPLMAAISTYGRNHSRAFELSSGYSPRPE